MKNILRLSCLSIFFCLAVNLHGQTFSFQCICDNVTGDTCDVCQTNSQVTSRLFCGILVYKNGTPFKWIDEPYTIRRLKNESLQFIELIPNPESITIGRWQTQFATMQGYVDSTTCQCASAGIDSLYAGFGINISGDTISVDTSLIATLYDLSLISTTTNLSFTGSSSPVTLNSSSGTDVTFTAGTGISIAATSSNATITNTAPDQTVSLSGTGITVGGTYPSFTLTAVDGSTTNELQTLSVAANTTTLSSGGGSMTIAGAGINTVGTAGSTITITGTEVDGSITNELQTLSVATNTATLSNSGGSVTIAGGGINTVGTAGTTITVTGTEVDGSITNEAQTLSASGTTAPTINLTSAGGAGGGTVTLNGAGITTLGQSGGTITITSTEADGSTTNELQTLSVAANTTTLSSSGGSMTIAGAGINTVGTAGSTITITGTEVDGSLSNEGSLTVGAGTGTTSIINSNTSGSTGVTLTAGTGMTISESGNIITLANSGLTGTGTSGYLPKFTGSTTVDNSNVFQLSSAIGVNTTTPDTALTVRINSTVADQSHLRAGIHLYDQNDGYVANASTGITFSRPNNNFSNTPMKVAGIHMGTDNNGYPELNFNILNGVTSGTDNTVVRLNRTGQVQFPLYTSASSFTGTKVGFLGNTSSGNVITIDPTGMVGPTELASTSVTPGSYTYPSITVDSDGRLTSVSNGTPPLSGSIASTQIAVGSGTNTVSGSANLTFTANNTIYLGKNASNYTGIESLRNSISFLEGGAGEIDNRVVIGRGFGSSLVSGTPTYTGKATSTRMLGISLGNSSIDFIHYATSPGLGVTFTPSIITSYQPGLDKWDFKTAAITTTGTLTVGSPFALNYDSDARAVFANANDTRRNNFCIWSGGIGENDNGFFLNRAFRTTGTGSTTYTCNNGIIRPAGLRVVAQKIEFIGSKSLVSGGATFTPDIYQSIDIVTGVTSFFSTVSIKGSGTTSGTYSLMVTNSSGTTSTAALAVRDDGKIGMGTNTPLATLHNVGDLLTIGILQSRGTGSAVSTTAAAGLRLYNTTASTGQSWNFESSNTGDLDLYNGGSTLVFKNENDTYGFAAGPNATSTLYGENTHAAGKFSSEGDAQASELVWRGAFTGTAGGELYLDGASLRAVLPTNSVWTGRIDMTAVCTALGNGTGTLATGQVYSISTNYVLKNIGGTVSAVPVTTSANASFTDTGMGSADVSAVANNTDKTWKVTFQAPSNAGSTSTFKVLAVARLHKISY